jgi:nucleoside-diphosphate-sugar epimerase
LREDDSLATEEAPLNPQSLYAETKVEFERHVLSRSAKVDFCPTVLRIATAYGLSRRMRFDLTISEFTRELALGRELLVYDADTWRPYCHVASISAAILTALDSPAELVRGEVFNVGDSRENYTKRSVVEVIQEHLGGKGVVRFTEGGSDPRNYRVSFDKIAERLGFVNRNTVPEAVGRLLEAIASGVFDDVEDRPGFYGNRNLEAVPTGQAAQA